jgi:hypothetical protein
MKSMNPVSEIGRWDRVCAKARDGVAPPEKLCNIFFRCDIVISACFRKGKLGRNSKGTKLTDPVSETRQIAELPKKQVKFQKGHPRS